ncbi:MAG: polyprenyl synthetase family protein [Bacteroidales bacterium]|nr:polyprenyl synthetase family protein [Bacteroidales bacterium]
MYSIEELIPIVNKAIDGHYNNRSPKRLYEPISYAMSAGGKRIRPILCLMACNVFSDDIYKALEPAIGLETFHNFTLLHDDIMDHADVRRNQPTVHKKWDENTAILSGDAMMIEAYEYFLNLPTEALRHSLKVFNQTAREVCEGQQFDMDFESISSVKIEDYLEMIRLKTAVLLAASLKIGSIIGGATSNDANLMYQFGIHMGMAFQLQDDYLDTFGDESTFGKKIGGDIVENKKTFLQISATEKNEQLMQELMQRTYKNNQEKISVITQTYRDLSIDKAAQNAILDEYKRAYEVLNSISVAENNQKELLKFLDQLKQRVF